MPMLKPDDLRLLAPELATGTARTFARRHLLRYRHPAVRAPDDFLASLRAAFGPPRAPGGYVLWHEETGRHFTAYVHGEEPIRLAAYGGGLRFPTMPSEPRVVAEAYREAAARLRDLRDAPDPLLADLLGDSGSYQAHLAEVSDARRRAPSGFFELLVRFEEELLIQFPPPDRREVVVHRGENAVHIVESGVQDGRYFERSPTVEDAYAAVLAQPDDRAVANLTFYRWWADKKRPPSLPREIAEALVPAWRACAPTAHDDVEGGTSYDEAAKARHDDHAQAERWMAHARAGLKLPLELADLDPLAASARGLARQSTELAKIEKERRKRRARP